MEKTKSNKVILSNTASLTLLQATNMLLPLIALPYLSRVLGPTNLGLVLFAQVFNRYFQIATEYGFDLTGTREISEKKDNLKRISKVFWDIIKTKLFLCVLSAIFLFLIVFGVPFFKENAFIYLLSFGVTIASVFSPTFFYQGIEKMKYITYANFISKLLSILLIFFLVKNKNDYYLVPFFYTLGAIISSIFSIVIAFKKFNIEYEKTSFKNILYQLKKGFNVFFSNITITGYTITNSLILGFFASSATIGIYIAIEKIILALKVIINPFYQASYPYLVNLYKVKEKKYWSVIKSHYIYSLIVMLVFASLVNVFSEFLITIILGEEFIIGRDLFRVFSILIVVSPLSYITFNNGLLILKKDKIYSFIYSFMTFFNCIILFIFLSTLNEKANAAALANVLTQIVGLIIGLYFLKKEFFKKFI